MRKNIKPTETSRLSSGKKAKKNFYNKKLNLMILRVIESKRANIE